MTCEDIKKKLKPFLEDLLAEDEYQEFITHVEECNQCNTYVNSIGALSNQLWQLGEVRIPEDLASTILFELKTPQPEVKEAKGKFIVSRRLFIGILVLILALAVSFFGINYLRKRTQAKKGEAPIITTQVIQEQKPSQEAEKLLKELHEIATTLSPASKKITPEEMPSNLEAPPTLDKPLTDSEAEMLEFTPLHWHFSYLREAGKIEAERKVQLEAKYQEELSLKQALKEERDKAIERHKTKFLEILHTRGITLDYQTDELFLFAASGKKIEEVLTQTLLSSQDIFFFSDFTQTVATLKEKSYRVSLYLESEGSLPHWHISPLTLEQKSNLFESIRGLGGVIEHQKEELVVFSLQQTEIEKLRTRIRAMRVSFSEFGKPESKEDQLISGPVKVSLYLTK